MTDLLTRVKAQGERLVKRIIPYPLRAARISFTWGLFCFWWPSFTYRKNLTEAAKAEGETIWWVRFACFQISYSRFR